MQDFSDIIPQHQKQVKFSGFFHKKKKKARKTKKTEEKRPVVRDSLPSFSFCDCVLQEKLRRSVQGMDFRTRKQHTNLPQLIPENGVFSSLGMHTGFNCFLRHFLLQQAQTLLK